MELSERWRLSAPATLHLPMLVRKFFPSRLAEPKLQRRLGEGAFKGVVVLPIREIGEVIFADFFRQPVAPKSDEGGSFAGVRVQALPFFNVASSVNVMGKSLRRFSARSTYPAIFAMNFVSSAQPVFIDGGQSAFNEPGQRLANS